MKRITAAFLIILLLMACLLAGADANRANAADPVECTVRVGNVICVAAGVTILNQPLNLPTVQVTVPGPTVTLPPPPRATVTNTVTVPGPTVTAPAAPGATQTITEPGSVTTITTGPTAGPTRLPGATQSVTETATAVTTVTATPRQDPSPSGTLDPDSGTIFNLPAPIVKTGVGFGIVSLLALLILLGMYGGYILGYKDSDKADANFFRALLNKE